MTENSKRQWIAPTVRRYGSFETATQQTGCDKQYGGADGYTFMGQAIVCVSAS